MTSLQDWIDRQYRYAATALLKSISRTDLVRERPGFGQSIRAAKGSIVASPVFGDWKPEPDYFFHWFRDSAVVIDALRILYVGRAVPADDAFEHLRDFVRFSRALANLEGRPLTDEQRAKVAPEFRQYLRDDAELAAVRGDAVIAETRVNPDGTLDITKWARPQHDGPPLRALALSRWLQHAPSDIKPELSALIDADLAFTAKHWREPSFDIWEEELGSHYYTLRVSAAALAERHPGEAQRILRELDRFWLEDQGYFRSRILPDGSRSAKELDVSVILAAIHACSFPGEGHAVRGEPVEPRGEHTVHDPYMQATLTRLEEHFAAAYPINHDRPAPALGRYPGDVYFDGGAWYVSTLAAAEFCYRLGERARGDAFLETVRAFTPESGELSEQFDQETGAQKSAKHLAWSYAAFISCVAARRGS